MTTVAETQNEAIFMEGTEVIPPAAKQWVSESAPCSKPKETIAFTKRIRKLKQVSRGGEFLLLTEYFELKCLNFKVGSTSHRFTAWKELTSDKTILDAIQGILIPLDELPGQQCNIKPSAKFNHTETNAINIEINTLLEKEVIECTEHEQGR